MDDHFELSPSQTPGGKETTVENNRFAIRFLRLSECKRMAEKIFSRVVQESVTFKTKVVPERV